MQVIVNLQPLLAPLTGVGHYTRELTRELVERCATRQTGQSIMGLSGLRVAGLASDHPLLADADRVAKRSPADHGIRHYVRRYLRNSVTRFAYQQLFIQRLRLYAMASRGATDRLYWEPGFIRLPWPGRSVVTVHDLSHCRYPEYHPRERTAFLNRHLAQGLARATRINVVSQFTAHELIDLFAIDPALIDIVTPGVASRFFSVDVTQRQQTRARYALPARYCLSVGTLEPRKNLSGLLRAFLGLTHERQRDCPMLLVGLVGWGEKHLPAGVTAAIDDGRIRRLGYVDDVDLPALYANATLFAYVSRYEGFGMPVIEAMAAGTPVITADRSATREVADGAALLVDPDDIEGIRHALVQLQDAPAQAEILRQAGYARASTFTWARSADALQNSFQHAMSQ